MSVQKRPSSFWWISLLFMKGQETQVWKMKYFQQNLYFTVRNYKIGIFGLKRRWPLIIEISHNIEDNFGLFIIFLTLLLFLEKLSKVNPNFFAKFSQELHEIERIWTLNGGQGVWGRGTSNILLCKSTTGLLIHLLSVADADFSKVVAF